MTEHHSQANTPKLQLVLGDITTQDVDVVVNAANESLLGGGGVDGAIHLAAGPALIEHCETLGGCDTGQAKITPGFDLVARWIVHAVGPIWHGGGDGESELLESCYRASLAHADAVAAASIAFPAISTGIYGYPIAAAARVAISTVQAVETKVGLVRFVAFDDATFDAYEDAFEWSNDRS